MQPLGVEAHVPGSEAASGEGFELCEFLHRGGARRAGQIVQELQNLLDGVRRDLYLVPVSIHYGRVVEEEAYKRELAGADKEQESLWSLLKARALLRQKFGTVNRLDE